MPLDSRPQTSRPRSSRYQGPLAYLVTRTRRRATIVGKDKLWRYVYVLSCPLPVFGRGRVAAVLVPIRNSLGLAPRISTISWTGADVG
jgi:hypothetical protein